ncbi:MULTISPECIES: prepilin peptidase [unclassified Micromonospora]|uniref:prepilin peptidase n=1 Tax=unclassified Micromonospora TaxID=2617518 RepID=UPI001C245133|nr:MULTISPECIES: prepilin peptidase [unclassified Micromonospora]MBU8858256.1 prepilin peptidase [Micromonospora sp. WMMB482]MDM4783899.1 prepilin peptidase [Micromonospora sp. b486]
MTAERVRRTGPVADPRRPSARLIAALTVVPLLRLAVARYAVPPGSPDRTACDGCGAPIGLDRPLPALGPAARCPACRARVGAAPAVVEVALLLAVAVPAVAGGVPAARLALAWWLVWAVPMTIVDAMAHRLPDRLTWPSAAGAWALLGVAALTGPGADPLVRAALAGLALGGGFAATTLLFGRRGFGLGDAKLALGAGALLGWYGWPVLVAGLVLALVLAGLAGVVLLAARRVRWSGHLPFGPFLVLGTAAALVLVTV